MNNFERESHTLDQYKQSIEDLDQKIQNLIQSKNQVLNQCQKYHKLCQNCLHHKYIKSVETGHNCLDCIQELNIKNVYTN